MFLRPRRKRFLSQLAHERTHSDHVVVSPDNRWFISLGQTIAELKNERSASILMWHEHYKSYVVYMDIIYDKNKQELFIGDVVSKVENKGYGSRALEFTIELADNLGCKVIRGNLGVADVDHFDKLKYWYEKYGFVVSIIGCSGTISRKI